MPGNEGKGGRAEGRKAKGGGGVEIMVGRQATNGPGALMEKTEGNQDTPMSERERESV